MGARGAKKAEKGTGEVEQGATTQQQQWQAAEEEERKEIIFRLIFLSAYSLI